MAKWSTGTTSVLGTAWMTGWTLTLISKETWLCLIKRRFSQKLTRRSAVTAPGHVGPLKTRHPHGTAMTKTFWRPNPSSIDGLMCHSPGPKNTALVGFTRHRTVWHTKRPESTFCELVCLLSRRLGSRGSQHILRAPQASAISGWAPWPFAGAQTRDDWSVCQSDGTNIARRSQQVRMGSFLSTWLTGLICSDLARPANSWIVLMLIVQGQYVVPSLRSMHHSSQFQFSKCVLSVLDFCVTQIGVLSFCFISFFFIFLQIYSQEPTPAPHSGSAVWPTRAGGSGHQLRPSPWQSRGRGHPVSAQFRKDARRRH